MAAKSFDSPWVGRQPVHGSNQDHLFPDRSASKLDSDSSKAKMVHVDLFGFSTIGRNSETKGGFSKKYADFFCKDDPNAEVEENTRPGSTNDAREDSSSRYQRVMDLWAAYAQNTSLHGVKNVNDKKSFVRLFWITAVLIMVVSMMWGLVNLVLRYQEHPFVTVSGFQREATILAPGITICIPERYHKTKVYLAPDAYKALVYNDTGVSFFNCTGEDCKKIMTNLDWLTELQHVTMTEFNDKVGHSVGDIFKDAHVRLAGKRYDFREHLVPIETEVSMCWTAVWAFNEDDAISKKYLGNKQIDQSKPKGKKYEYDYQKMIPLRIGASDHIFLTLNINQENWIKPHGGAGASVYLHPQNGEFWSVRPIHLRPGTFNTIFYKTTKYKFLPPPFNSFAPDNMKQGIGCLDTESPEFRNPMAMLPKNFYSSEMCAVELSLNTTGTKCGCSTIRHYKLQAGLPECSIIQYLKCSNVVYKEYKKITQSFSNSRCPRSCTSTTFEATYSAANYPSKVLRKPLAYQMRVNETTLEDDVLVIVLQPQSDLTMTVEHVPEFSFLGVIGSVGGWMGLCLGASLLTLTEFIETFMTTIYLVYRTLRIQK